MTIWTSVLFIHFISLFFAVTSSHNEKASLFIWQGHFDSPKIVTQIREDRRADADKGGDGESIIHIVIFRHRVERRRELVLKSQRMSYKNKNPIF